MQHKVRPSSSLLRLAQELLDTSTAAERQAEAEAAAAAASAAAAPDKSTAQPDATTAAGDVNAPLQSDQRTYSARQTANDDNPAGSLRGQGQAGASLVLPLPPPQLPLERNGRGAAQARDGARFRALSSAASAAGSRFLSSVGLAGGGSAGQGSPSASAPARVGVSEWPRRLYEGLVAGARGAARTPSPPAVQPSSSSSLRNGGANDFAFRRLLSGGSGGGVSGIGGIRTGGVWMGGIRRV
jgi:pyruvate/2-oxoglutarate dehydrogenase complex dihydrolipoamide acyltransferase (E2) component